MQYRTHETEVFLTIQERGIRKAKKGKTCRFEEVEKWGKEEAQGKGLLSRGLINYSLTSRGAVAVCRVGRSSLQRAELGHIVHSQYSNLAHIKACGPGPLGTRGHRYMWARRGQQWAGRD